MRIIVREYLSMLKEEGELDALIDHLCFSMGLNPISRPQKGVRQHGVDLKVSGRDPTDQLRKVFLFVLKRGDLNRRTWDGGPQSVRESLNEILDVYVRTMLEPELTDLPKKIVVCCNGTRHQEVEINWSQYVQEKSEAGALEIVFWGSDMLADLIAQHVFDENLFPERLRGHVRKTLVFLDSPDYNLNFFFELIQDVLSGMATASKKERIKALRMLNLSLAVVWRWSGELGNLKPAVLAAERLFLSTWDWRRRGGLLDDRDIGAEFATINMTRVRINLDYLNKLGKLYLIKDGLFGWSTSGLTAMEVEYPLLVFEEIGLLGSIGLDFLSLSNSDEDLNALSQWAEGAVIALCELIKNNKVSLSPVFDGHGIDICLGLLLLYNAGRKDEAVEWVSDIFGRIFWAYKIKNRFPLFSDSYDDLLEVTLGSNHANETSSTLLPMLLEWCVVLGASELYSTVREQVLNLFPEVNLQLWYADELTEDFLYTSDASKKSGSTFHSIQLPEDFDDFSREVIEHFDTEGASDQFSFVKHRYESVGFMASRHFRTPMFPFYWRSLLAKRSDL